MKRIIAFVITLFLSSLTFAQSWDAAADFNPGENPRMVWSYGWTDGISGEFTPMIDRGRDNCGIPFPGFDCFGANNGFYPLPQIMKNNSGVGVVWDQTDNGKDYPSIATYGLGAIFMRPDTYFGIKWPVLRFTAPVDDTYTIIGSAQLVDVATRGAILHIACARPRVDKQLLVFGQAQHFQLAPKLKAGEHCDFTLEPVGVAWFATTALRVSAMRLK